MAVAALARGDEGTPFLIERIEIRNAKYVSPEIVVAEGRLREGGQYGEAALRDANDRLRRLPYLIDAQFSLEKGSERGSYVLVITITETKPFFYLADLTGYTSSTDQFVTDQQNEALAGFRAFIGRRGVVHVGVFAHRDDHPYISRYTALETGYTRYEVFGTRAFATVSLRAILNTAGGPGVLPALVVGIPLSGNQTVTIEYEHFAIGQQGRRLRQAERLATARWTYDTTNHPFFPTRGTIFSVTPLVTWTDVTDAGTVDRPAVTLHRRTYGMESSVSRFRELSELWSVSFRGRGGWAAIDEVFDTGDRAQTVAYGSGSIRLTRLLARDQDSEKRLEASWSVTSEERRTLREGGLYFGTGFDPATYSLSLNWVRRDAWGTLRLGAGYAW